MPVQFCKKWKQRKECSFDMVLVLQPWLSVHMSLRDNSGLVLGLTPIHLLNKALMKLCKLLQVLVPT